MKLNIELVPSTSWFTNLRSILPTSDWDLLRRAVYKDAGYKCEVCGGKGDKHPVECHERWAYDDVNHVQTLVGLIALCPSCHMVKHFGLAAHRGYDKVALKHLMIVNKWNKEEATSHVNDAFRTWSDRSNHQWKVDCSIVGIP